MPEIARGEVISRATDRQETSASVGLASDVPNIAAHVVRFVIHGNSASGPPRF